MNMTRWEQWSEIVREAHRVVQARGVTSEDIPRIHSAGMYLGALLYTGDTTDRMESNLSDILTELDAPRVRP